MIIQRPRRQTLLVWITGYLWIVPAVITLSRVLNWQYDADIGWWVVMAFTAPIIMLTEPFGSAVPFPVYTTAYLVVLFAMTLLVVRNWDSSGSSAGN
ncbi:hypothetical protein [Sphingomonas sp. Leaf230]|uniref:hypothetical protein n=1 Tax=Sphingomonas sp. Leaf230 TaxID=1735694 RepID=UPI0012E20A12|nr:hypothetical protein [Sphingomonas sp. Leaf230]